MSQQVLQPARAFAEAVAVPPPQQANHVLRTALGTLQDAAADPSH